MNFNVLYNTVGDNPIIAQELINVLGDILYIYIYIDR